MHIKQIISQTRRDFYAIYECEHCKHSYEDSGYDDAYFHSEVVPEMKCKKCGATASEEYVPKQTKYPEGFQV